MLRQELDDRPRITCPGVLERDAHRLVHDRLGVGEKRELLGLIEDYARGLVPLIVPITLVNHYVNRFDLAYIRDQVYLRPHPKELMLRNHV